MLRTRFALFSVVVACAVVVLAVTAAGADTASDLSEARQRLAAAQANANAAADELSVAQSRYVELETRIGQLDAQIEASSKTAQLLQSSVRARAVRAYTQRGISDFDLVLAADDPLDAARRTQLLDRANQKDNDAVRKLAALREDLGAMRKQVQAQRDDQRAVKERLDARNAEVQSSLAAASKARDELAARLQREEADAAAAAELARLRATQAASQAASAAAPNSAPGQIVANPGGGSFQCPLAGSAYGTSYGPRSDGFHNGIDMFAPSGVPEVAVKAGTVSYIPMGGAGGNEAYLAANDGNVYYYAHMSQFVGGPRAVSQGEIIGLVGSTGRSTGPHLHFEIRVGGANGQRIDPYPTLQGAGC